jgi:hypothetical protein
VSRDRNASCTWKMSWWHVSAAPRRNFASRLHTHTVIILGAPGHKFHSTPARRLSAKKKSAGVHTHTLLVSRGLARLHGDRSFCGGAGTNKSYATLGVHLMIYECTPGHSQPQSNANSCIAHTNQQEYICAVHACACLSLAAIAWHTSLSQSAKGKAPREPRSGVREAPLNWRPHSLCDPNTHTYSLLIYLRAPILRLRSA